MEPDTNCNRESIDRLREWMKKKGCLIHPDIEIPSNLNGVQGVSTKKQIDPKTVILAIPSSLIITV
jgi:hypothetical protein